MPPGRRPLPEASPGAMGCFTWGLSDRPAVQGHRGAGYAAPPNSMEAMIRASQMNLDSVEFDVWQLRCGTLIVAHGPEFLEAGDIGLRKFTLEELEQEEEEEFSLFSQVVRFCVKKSMRMNIDVKGDDPYVIDGILKELDALDATHMASVSAFEHRILERVLELNASLKIGVLHDPYSVYSDNPKFIPSKKQPLRKDFATYLCRPGDSINLGVEAVTPSIVRACHKRGVQVMAWFACVPQVTEGEETLLAYERLVRAGVDTICCNQPQRLQEYLDARFMMSGYCPSPSACSSSEDVSPASDLTRTSTPVSSYANKLASSSAQPILRTCSDLSAGSATSSTDAPSSHNQSESDPCSPNTTAVCSPSTSKKAAKEEASMAEAMGLGYSEM
jgi:glycerophosphoryl diester phosphodiesterase